MKEKKEKRKYKSVVFNKTYMMPVECEPGELVINGTYKKVKGKTHKLK